MTRTNFLKGWPEEIYVRLAKTQKPDSLWEKIVRMIDRLRGEI